MLDETVPARTFGAGAALLALAIGAGAFGAHLLDGRLSPHHAALWDTAARYAALGGVALLAMGAAAANGRMLRAVRRGAPGLIAGTLLFSCTVAALALGAPGWLGAITPIGGGLMIASLVYCAAATLR